MKSSVLEFVGQDYNEAFHRQWKSDTTALNKVRDGEPTPCLWKANVGDRWEWGKKDGKLKEVARKEGKNKKQSSLQ